MSRRSPLFSSRVQVLVQLLVQVLVVATLVALSGGSAQARSDVDPVGVWPLSPAPEVTGRFGPPADPWGSGHRGVDLAGRVGQPVRAALAGHVSFAGRIAGRGVVVVSHGDTRTTYEPVTAALSVGDVVAAGGPLGRLELVGSHCYPRACLHWGWLRGETYLDPLRLVGGGPVRLLPLWRDLAARPLIRPLIRPVGGPVGRPFAGGRW